MNALKFVLLFALIGLGYAQDGPGLLTPGGILSQIAHGIETILDDIVDGEDFNRSPFRGVRVASDDDDETIWGSAENDDIDEDYDWNNLWSRSEEDEINDLLKKYFKNSDGNPHVERRVYRQTFDGPEDLDLEDLERDLRRFFPDAGNLRPSGPRGGRPQNQQRRGTFPRRDGPSNSQPTPDLKLNKTDDCICRLRTKSRIVNGQEATPNR